MTLSTCAAASVTILGENLPSTLLFETLAHFDLHPSFTDWVTIDITDETNQKTRVPGHRSVALSLVAQDWKKLSEHILAIDGVYGVSITPLQYTMIGHA